MLRWLGAAMLRWLQLVAVRIKSNLYRDLDHFCDFSSAAGFMGFVFLLSNRFGMPSRFVKIKQF